MSSGHQILRRMKKRKSESYSHTRDDLSTLPADVVMYILKFLTLAELSFRRCVSASSWFTWNLGKAIENVESVNLKFSNIRIVAQCCVNVRSVHFAGELEEWSWLCKLLRKSKDSLTDLTLDYSFMASPLPKITPT
eukprot:TRINITY_DN9780_c0_g1_i1.p1 TRINITY_DN9780_c0_g1~~TRINITY_DN9780_c0_g1_i1.p1  ORF type:complete len:136 (-),score=16.06 TRINITY_DN9780_c0_g1_i1:253-660(-)